MKLFFKAGFFLSVILVVLNFSSVQCYEKSNQIIITDKPYYSVEDTIRYAVMGLDQTHLDTALKDIYFVELWDSENHLLHRHIHRIRDHILYGSFFVSPDEKTGWKIIRAYPQNPLNSQQIIQTHLPILLFGSDSDEAEIRDYLLSGFSRKERIEDGVVELELNVNLNQEAQETRNEIRCTVKMPESLQWKNIIPLVATAYFEDFFPSMGYNFNNSMQYGFEYRHNANSGGSDEILPEGLMLKGIYEMPEEDKSKIFAMVTLSHLGMNPGILYNYTNLKNEFSFDLSDMEGDVSAYLSVLDGYSDRIHILPDSVPDLTLEYSESDRTDWLMPLLRYQGNRKIQKIVVENYSSLLKSDSAKEISIYDTTRIYAKADRSYKLSDYIAFKDVRELIVEILPYVKIQEDNGSYNIYIVNNQNPDLDTNSPLYFVNGIPTKNADFIASLDVSNIDIVEVLYSKEALYPFNWLGKGGILALYTKTPVQVPNFKLHSIKGIYPDRGNYRMNEVSDEVQFYAPQIEPAIFWHPQLKVDSTGSVSFNFHTGDQTGLLNVCVFGVGPDGEILYGKDLIQISTFIHKTSNER